MISVADKGQRIKMSELELTQAVLSSMNSSFKLTDKDKKALSLLEFKKVGYGIRVQGQYEIEDEERIAALWPLLTKTIKTITGCENIIDNRICIQRNQPGGSHCIRYTTEGALKPTEWEYVPLRELTKQQQRRACFFKGNYIRLSPKQSVRKFFPETTPES